MPLELDKLDRISKTLYNHQGLTLKLTVGMSRSIGAEKRRESPFLFYEVNNKLGDARSVPKLDGMSVLTQDQLVIETKAEWGSPEASSGSNKIYLDTMDIPIILHLFDTGLRWFKEDCGVFKHDGTGKLTSVAQVAETVTMMSGLQVTLQPIIIADGENSDIQYEGVNFRTNRMSFSNLTSHEFLALQMCLDASGKMLFLGSTNLIQLAIAVETYKMMEAFVKNANR